MERGAQGTINVLTLFKWTLFTVALSPIVVGIGYAIVEGSILPWLIPRAEIERLANELAARYPADPEGAAFNEEQAAWYRSEGRVQGKWHRVRKCSIEEPPLASYRDRVAIRPPRPNSRAGCRPWSKQVPETGSEPKKPLLASSERPMTDRTRSP